MPVIRASRTVPKLPQERRAALLGRLVAELNGAADADGPVIFEIPLPQSDLIDAMVVWDAWAGVPSQDRTQIIQDAYGPTADTLSLALGVTTDEAVAQGLLPFRVEQLSGDTTAIPTDTVADAFRAAGLRFHAGAVETRVPSKAIAVQVADQLERALPGTRWTVRESA